MDKPCRGLWSAFVSDRHLYSPLAWHLSSPTDNLNAFPVSSLIHLHRFKLNIITTSFAIHILLRMWNSLFGFKLYTIARFRLSINYMYLKSINLILIRTKSLIKSFKNKIDYSFIRVLFTFRLFNVNLRSYIS